VTRNLLSSYGTRYDITRLPRGIIDGGERYDPATDKVLSRCRRHADVDGVDVGLGQLAPRLGVAWRATGKTVLRGGFGIASTRIPSAICATPTRR